MQLVQHDLEERFCAFGLLELDTRSVLLPFSIVLPRGYCYNHFWFPHIARNRKEIKKPLKKNIFSKHGLGVKIFYKIGTLQL